MKASHWFLLKLSTFKAGFNFVFDLSLRFFFGIAILREHVGGVKMAVWEAAELASPHN